jgi:copper oxidase (laccase) domain-containing protein
MTGNIHQYDLGKTVANGIETRCPMGNCYVKYGGEPMTSQLRLLSEIGASNLFDRRVMIGAVFGNSVLRVKDLSFSGYKTEQEPICMANSGYEAARTMCNGYDGVITSMKGLPIMIGWGDCPELLVAGKNTVGIVHSTGKTLDKFILDNFFAQFFETECPVDTRVAFSPYLFTEHYTGDFRNLARFDEWSEAGVITGSIDDRQHLDLEGANMRDLLRLGILHENIHNAHYSSYNLSALSHELGGYAVSHRHATNTPGAKEGRGAMCIMLRGH